VASALGDEIVPGANMVFDHRAVVGATPEAVWPWLVQLGKRRAGWYLPSSVERLLPSSRRASVIIEPLHQRLGIGDRIPDYGGRDEYLEVVLFDPPRALVYRSARRGRPFSWALLLTPVATDRCELRLRFRGRIRSRGPLRWAILAVGGFFDRSTGRLMVRGLQERVRQT
jgi:hypothetical protein